MIGIPVALVLTIVLAAGSARADDSERELELGGRERTYRLHLPANADPTESLPLVIVMHGAGGNPRVIELQSGFSELADSRGFAVAYPAGTRSRFAALMTLLRGRHFTWNAGECCGWAQKNEIDDVAFLRALVEDVARTHPIDRARVYAAGLSNGGMMAYRLACEASDSFAAIGVVAGALVTPGCAPSRPVSVIHMHAKGDPIVPFGGGAGAFSRDGFSYPPTQSAIDFWTGANGGRAAVELRALDSTRHNWPKDASETLWEFFASHPRPEETR